MKTEVSKAILGRMLSKESTEDVVKHVSVEYAKWKSTYNVKLVSPILWNMNESQLFDYWINNIYKYEEKATI